MFAAPGLRQALLTEVCPTAITSAYSATSHKNLCLATHRAVVRYRDAFVGAGSGAEAVRDPTLAFAASGYGVLPSVIAFKKPAAKIGQTRPAAAPSN